MGKIKTHKASAKRYKLTATGKVKKWHGDHRHNLGQKSAKRKRNLRSGSYLSESMAPTVRRLLNK